MTLRDGERVYLEHYDARWGMRRWHPARLRLDPVAGTLTFAFRRGWGRPAPLTLPLSRVTGFQVQQRPLPQGGLYEAAVLVLLILPATYFLERYQLKGFWWKMLLNLLPLLVAASLGALVPQALKVPVVCLSCPPDGDEVRAPWPIRPFDRALKDRLRRELEEQGHTVTDAELEGAVAGQWETLPPPVRQALERLDSLTDYLSPHIYRLHGRGWRSILQTHGLAEQLEAVLQSWHAPIADWDTRPAIAWEASQRLVILTQLIALLVVGLGIGYTLWRAVGSW